MTLNLRLHRKQGMAFQSTATEILYGGAAGGGKSHLMRVLGITLAAQVPGLQVYLFRRIREDLVKNHMEGPSGFRSMLAGWTQSGLCRIVDDEVRFWNGAKIYLCHCKDEKDIYKYQGAEIHVLLIDELTHFLESMYRFLRNRVRLTGLTLPKVLEHRLPLILCGANPGNIGHAWVKKTFVDASEPYVITQTAPDEGGMKRQFIPARLDDNPSMTEADPGYEQRLQGLGSDALVRAMRWGDWDVVEGAFFDCWNQSRHVVKPFAIPQHWLRFRSMDWGSASPFSVGWWAVASERSVVANAAGAQVTIPVGALVRYREWYGASKPNVGLKMSNEAIAAGIIERERGDQITYGVLDPACFANNGGPSIAEQYARSGLYFTKADNARVAASGPVSGWSAVRSRMIGDGDGNPMLVTFSTCRDLIRTVPILQHDSSRPEDLDTSMEDHAADEMRYACLSRPWTRPQPAAAKPRDVYRHKARQQEPDSWRTL